ncbi:PQQ-binding-like beta-propeller repeat protein [Gimesia aquarii]|uniref:Alcohol dehydrogenase [cytochrome c] n=1 Tax=Gimesia aquarii TaxID=2527964 RepID=A0A517WY30_9PLAN|nr:PQQ-binding-like beta-propeller repeat protein [Gimesia aquarii]QDU10159.1 Alcohol dehydrogenase [cytochrome c] precursor [Gimesia aquarii]
MPNIFSYQMIFTLLFLHTLLGPTQASDWPMWRLNAQRSAKTEQTIPDTLHVHWVHHLPQLDPAFKNARLQFDAGYEPIVKNGILFYGSSDTNSVTALDVKTGKELWRFYTNGPVRLAPVAWKDSVLFGSDDGYLYSLAAQTGALQWKFQAVPSSRLILGNRRLISVWPVRGGPVVDEDTIYFAAGVWPFEGIFIYALNAETGERRWINDRLGYIYGQHPHAAEAFGGVTPQGYLLITGDELIVPCGTAFPARLNKQTGELIEFQLPKAGRKPGGWFTAAGKAARRGETEAPKSDLLFDRDVNSARHENGQNYGPDGKRGIRQQIQAGEKQLTYQKQYPGVTGTIHSMLVASNRLLITTLEGSIYCLGSEKVSTQKHVSPALNRQETTQPQATGSQLPSVISKRVAGGGNVLLAGIPDTKLIEGLLTDKSLYIVALESDLDQAKTLRHTYYNQGWTASEISFIEGPLSDFEMPAYFAQLIIAQEPQHSGFESFLQLVTNLYPSLRPYGGSLLLNCTEETHSKLKEEFRDLSQAQISRHSGYTVIEKAGAIPGSTNYTGGWSSPDELVKAPVGVLWYDDSVGNFKRAPQPMFVDGVMISHSKYWQGYPAGIRPPYKLLKPQYSDVYTGRTLNEKQAKTLVKELPTRDQTQKQPSQYRPPYQKNDWSPAPPVIGERTNPLTGQSEPRAFPKSYGCDGGVDYSYLYTMRSGTAAFYDKRVESGTIHISGPRSGCTNSIVPANGLLNVPYYFQGCTCSYPLPVGLSLISMPEVYEQWMVWGKSEAKEIRRVGLNFGAPGDRKTDRGTLWLDAPSVGGPSPELDLTIEPKNVTPFYQHSLWVEGGRGWPWVGASGISGVKSITLKNLKRSNYTLRLYFVEPEFSTTEQRIFSVSLNGKPLIKDLDIYQETQAGHHIHVREFSQTPLAGTLNLAFTATKGKPLICGVELVEKNLPLDTLVKLPTRKQRLLTKVNP